ncbi:hypothetical protein MFLAVUS_005565 [Mucor flavus]|uniref:F-box domain-containing protein n=1 Tax=Mucor flavus TaxID=439312 RepID=A0ABP9YZ17_9FUNG
MASWGGLPIEILYCILGQLTNPTDLSTCLTICNNWHKAAQEIVYNNVELSSSLQVTCFANCMVKARRIGGPSLLVKKISVFGDVESNSAECLENCLSDILQFCDNIKTIETVGFNPGNSFFEQIMQQLDQDNCLLLENIPFPSIKDEDIRAYEYTSWVLRDRLTCLMISDRAEQINLGSADNNELLLGLKSFPRLKYLMYYIKDSESLYKIGSIIKNFSSLQLVEINQHRRTSTLDHHVVDLTSRNPCTQVEGFIGSGIIMPSSKMLKYIMATFPKLRLLNLAFAMITLKSQLSLENSLSTEACVEFLSTAYRKIYTLNIEQLYVENAVGVASGFLDDVNFDGILEIRYENDHNHPQYINMTRRKLIVQCVQPVNALYTVLPHRELIQRFGRNLVGVSLDFGDAYTLYQEVNHRELHKNDVHGYCLDYIFKYCLHLESLELANFLFTQCDPELTVSNTLQVLIFDCCEFSNMALQELSKRIPSLTLLCIIDSDFEYDSIWDLPIYNTLVTAIHWKDTGHEDSQDDYSQFHLCIEKGSHNTLFYSGNKYHVEQCFDNGDAYHKTFDVDDILNINVACKHIEYFHLDIPNIKMLITNPGHVNQAIFVHPSLQYHQEVNRLMENKQDS